MKRGRSETVEALARPRLSRRYPVSVLLSVCLLLLTAGLLPAEVIEETGSLRGFLAGDCPTAAYDNWISHTTEGIANPGYNHYGPTGLDRQLNGFGDFRQLPDNYTGRSCMEHWQTIFSAFLEGRLEDADILLADSADIYRYEVVRFHDTEFDRDYGILREVLDDSYVDNAGTPANPEDDVTGGFQNAWGVYIINLDSPRPYFLVQMVHPNDDFLGVQAAVEIFLGSNAGALSIAGCGREVLWTQEGSYANSKSLSDPSRYPVSVTMAFQNAFNHRFESQYPPGTMVMQCHSFDYTHETPKSVILSAGQYETFIHKPLWDRTPVNHDFIALTPPAPVPAFSFGVHEQVAIEDYYWLNYPEETPYYYHLTQVDSVQIPRATYLRCDPNNVQENTLHENYLSGSTYENFIHFELDEFPTVLWDAGLDWEDLIGPERPPTYETFANLMEYYDPFYQAIYDWFDLLDSRQDTVGPDTLHNIFASQSGNNYPYVHWTPIKDTDFVTYEVLADTQELTEESPVVWDFHNDPELREMGYDGWTQVLNAPDGQPLYMTARAVDYYGNRSGIGMVSEVTGYVDNDPVGLEPRSFAEYPLAAWPAWAPLYIADWRDLDSAWVEYWTSSGLEGTFAVRKAVWTLEDGAMFGDSFPLEATQLSVGDTVYWRASATDRSATGNLETLPEEGWYAIALTDGPANPYESDFEEDNGELLPYGGSDWEWGQPGTGPDEAHSGDNLWATELNGNYRSNQSSLLRLGGPDLTGYPPMVATWWQWYQFEAAMDDRGEADDGAFLELKQGATTYPARVMPRYTSRIVSNIDVQDSLVYSGNGTAWHAAAIDLNWMFGGGPNAGGFNLYFLAVSDNASTRPGWYIDDLMVASHANVYPPRAFTLLQPANDDVANPFGPTTFAWNRSIDPDPFTFPEYDLFITLGEDTVSVYAGADTVLTVQLDSLAIETPEFAYATWWVRATSQGDAVLSYESRELAVPPFNAVGGGEHKLPREFALEAAYPNPFNPSITLKFATPRSEVIELAVFNVLGQRVSLIDRRLREPGRHRVTWTADNFASGTYVITMKAGARTIASRKIVLVK